MIIQLTFCMVPENCRESLLTEKFCGGRKITCTLCQDRRVVDRVVGIGSRSREGRGGGLLTLAEHG